MNINEIYQNCQQFLHWQKQISVASELYDLAKYAKSLGPDRDAYGNGQFLNKFENDIAEFLGKESGLFFVSGVQAQQVALRYFCDSNQSKSVAFHESSHLARNEFLAYEFVHNMTAEHIGESNRTPTLKDIKALKNKPTAILLELPMRHLGGELIEWGDLIEISKYCHSQKIKLHMDGARLWETKNYYQKSYTEICALFDSVYVSFYKGLSANGGAMLLGSNELIEEAKIWRKRIGGTLFQLYPLALSAHQAFHQNLKLADSLVTKAKEVAKIFSSTKSMRVIPHVPQTHMFHLLFQGDFEKVMDAKLKIARDYKIWLCARPYEVDKLSSRAEVYLTVGSLQIETKLITQAVLALDQLLQE